MKRIQEMIRRQPGNPWIVYQACKVLEETLLPLNYTERAALLRQKLPGATREAISEGLAKWTLAGCVKLRDRWEGGNG